MTNMTIKKRIRKRKFVNGKVTGVRKHGRSVKSNPTLLMRDLKDDKEDEVYIEIRLKNKVSIHLGTLLSKNKDSITFEIGQETVTVETDKLQTTINDVTYTLREPTEAIETQYYLSVIPKLFESIALPKDDLNYLVELHDKLKEVFHGTQR